MWSEAPIYGYSVCVWGFVRSTSRRSGLRLGFVAVGFHSRQPPLLCVRARFPLPYENYRRRRTRWFPVESALQLRLFAADARRMTRVALSDRKRLAAPDGTTQIIARGYNDNVICSGSCCAHVRRRVHCARVLKCNIVSPKSSVTISRLNEQQVAGISRGHY